MHRKCFVLGSAKLGQRLIHDKKILKKMPHLLRLNNKLGVTAATLPKVFLWNMEYMLPVFKDDKGLLTHIFGINIIGVGGHSMEEDEGPSLCRLSTPINTLN